MHYELFQGVPAIAVGLSAISLLASFPFPKTKSRSPKPNLVPKNQIPFPFPNPVPDSLAKDAAPIPNASEAMSIELRAMNKDTESVSEKENVV